MLLPFLVSNTIKKIYVPKSVEAMHWFKNICSSVDVEVVEFSGYFDRWHNTEKERQIMIDYVMKDKKQIDKLIDM